MSPKWGYPNFDLLITLLTKSHEPLSRVFDTSALLGGSGSTRWRDPGPHGPGESSAS